MRRPSKFGMDVKRVTINCGRPATFKLLLKAIKDKMDSIKALHPGMIVEWRLVRPPYRRKLVGIRADYEFILHRPEHYARGE